MGLGESILRGDLTAALAVGGRDAEESMERVLSGGAIAEEHLAQKRRSEARRPLRRAWACRLVRRSWSQKSEPGSARTMRAPGKESERRALEDH